jgi:hypothetical protein
LLVPEGEERDEEREGKKISKDEVRVVESKRERAH